MSDAPTTTTTAEAEARLEEHPFSSSAGAAVEERTLRQLLEDALDKLHTVARRQDMLVRRIERLEAAVFDQLGASQEKAEVSARNKIKDARDGAGKAKRVRR